MATFTVLYTKPDDAEQFLEEYTTDHLAIAARFPRMTSSSTTVFSGTPRGTDAPYYLMFHGVWDSMDDLKVALGDPVLMEASGHAMGMLKKYGNSAEMMIGDGA